MLLRPTTGVNWPIASFRSKIYHPGASPPRFSEAEIGGVGGKRLYLGSVRACRESVTQGEEEDRGLRANASLWDGGGLGMRDKELELEIRSFICRRLFFAARSLSLFPRQCFFLSFFLLCKNPRWVRTHTLFLSPASVEECQRHTLCCGPQSNGAISLIIKKLGDRPILLYTYMCSSRQKRFFCNSLSSFWLVCSFSADEILDTSSRNGNEVGWLWGDFLLLFFCWGSRVCRISS